MPTTLPRRVYADMFGPTTGDRVRSQPRKCLESFRLWAW
jgi:urease alpha subunit